MTGLIWAHFAAMANIFAYLCYRGALVGPSELEHSSIPTQAPVCLLQEPRWPNTSCESL